MNKYELKFILKHQHQAKSVEPIHTHPCCEIVYYVSGKGTLTIGEKKYDYKPNTYALFSKNIEHSEFHKEDTDVLFFAFENNDEFLSFIDGIYEDKNGKILSIMEKIWDEVHNRLPYFNLACDLLIGELLLEFSRQNPIEKKQGNEKNLQIAIDYINMNIQHDINVNEIASAIGYSYDYFRHQFQKIYGIGIKEYIIKEKIKRIKQRLENTDDSLDLIAKDYSYSNQAHFSSSFKKVTGCTPSEYRKKINSRTKKILVKYSKKRTL